MAVLAKATFNDLRGLKMRVNGYEEDIDELDKSFMSFLEKTNQRFITYMQHIIIKMLSRAFQHIQKH